MELADTAVTVTGANVRADGGYSAVWLPGC